MKRTVFAGLFLTTALLASPVFAADEDLCTTNLQTLKDAHTSTSTNYDDDAKKRLETVIEQGAAAKKALDTKKCIEVTDKAIQDLKRSGSGTDGGAAK